MEASASPLFDGHSNALEAEILIDSQEMYKNKFSEYTKIT